jgi:hypothetical protein
LHTAFGVAKRGQSRMLRVQQQKVVGQLIVDKTGSVRALESDDAQMF